MALIAALTAVAVLCGACTSGNADPAASPSPLTFGPPSFPPTASPAPDDPYAIPDEIDAAYVEKVFDALARVEGEALELLREAHGREQVLPPGIRDRLRAIYGPESFPVVAAFWQQEMTAAEPPDIPSPSAPVSIDVLDVLEAARSCVVVLASYDFAGVTLDPPQEEPVQFLALVPLDSSRDPNGFNLTPWIIADEVERTDNAPSVEQLCAD